MVVGVVAPARTTRLLDHQARLERAPRFELEAGDAAAWTGRDRLDRLDDAAWRSAAWDGTGIEVRYSADGDPELIRPIWEDLRDGPGGVWRISIRRAHPHVEVHMPIPNMAETDARRYTQAFLEVARNVMP